MNKQGNKAKEECSTKTGKTKSPTNQTHQLNEVARFVSFVIRIKWDIIIPTMLTFATPFQSLLHLHHLYHLL